MEINLDQLLEKYRNHPYEDHVISTPHTGVIKFQVEEGQEVHGPRGKWLEKPGSLLYILERERNPKRIAAPFDGTVADLRRELDGEFIHAGEQVLTIRHRLSKDEVIDRILREVLYIFAAPQRARYYLVPEFAARLEKKGGQIPIEPGSEFIIMSLMKRDTLVKYDGVQGVIYKIYFKNGDLVEQDQPLVGICPPDQLPFIQKVVQHIRNEWEE